MPNRVDDRPEQGQHQVFAATPPAYRLNEPRVWRQDGHRDAEPEVHRARLQGSVHHHRTDGRTARHRARLQRRELRQLLPHLRLTLRLPAEDLHVRLRLQREGRPPRGDLAAHGRPLLLHPDARHGRDELHQHDVAPALTGVAAGARAGDRPPPHGAHPRVSRDVPPRQHRRQRRRAHDCARTLDALSRDADRHARRRVQGDPHRLHQGHRRRDRDVLLRPGEELQRLGTRLHPVSRARSRAQDLRELQGSRTAALRRRALQVYPDCCRRHLPCGARRRHHEDGLSSCRLRRRWLRRRWLRRRPLPRSS